MKNVAKIALKVTRKQLKDVSDKRFIGTRVIPIPKVGGIILIIPIFAKMSLIGRWEGTTAGVSKACVSGQLQYHH